MPMTTPAWTIRCVISTSSRLGVGIAGRVVVKQHHARCDFESRLAEDVARVDDARIERADGDDGGAQQPVAAVEQQRAEVFDRTPPELRDEEAREIVGRTELRPRLRAAASTARRPSSSAASTRARMHGADARDAEHLGEPRTSETAKAARAGEQCVCQRERVGARRAVPEDQGHQLVVAERRGAHARELLARAIVRGRGAS